MRQNTHLGISQNSPPPVATPYALTPFRVSVAVDDFLGDFSHEFPLEDTHVVRPFMTGTLGAVRMSTPASAATRFAFGVGAGIKVFPSPRYGFRLQVEYLGIVRHANVQTVVCVSGCTVALDGGVTSQFQVSVGPAFRF
jgi:hypothetical protein